MKKLMICAIAALASAMPAAAETLSAEQALSRALKSDGPARVRALNSQAMTLAYTAEGSEFYVFNRGESDGYLIASGDTRMRPVLGIVDNGSFDYNNEQLREWLNFYKAEISVMANSASVEINSDVNRYDNYADWQPIEPLVKTQWNQTWPYNSKTPTINGNNCPTGCVATALAQIINQLGYYNGTGSITYTTAGAERTYDFTQWTPDFSKMPATISDDSPQEEIDEVSELMLACGMAVSTGYNQYSASASESNTIGGPCKYLGFNSSYCKTYYRFHFDTPKWEAFIYDQLAAGRSVCYNGSGDSGHSFVCDGYSSDGLFHFNWGWGGLNDGYFALSALNPTTQSSGVAEGGYNVEQFICLFASPDDENKPNGDSYMDYPVYVLHEGVAEAPTMGNNIDKFEFWYGVWKTPLSEQPFKLAATLLLKNTDGVSDDILMNTSSYQSMSLNSNGWNFSINYKLTDVPAGEYNAYFVTLVEGYDHYVPSYNYWNKDNDHWLLKIDENGKRTYTVVPADSKGVKIAEVNDNGGLYAKDADNVVTVTLANSSDKDWIEKLKMQIVRSTGKTTVIANTCYPYVPAHGSVDLKFDASSLTAGTYTVELLRADITDTPLVPCSTTAEFTVNAGSRPTDTGDEGTSVDVDGLLFQLTATDNTATLVGVSDNTIAELNLPATVSHEGADYALTAIAADAVSGNSTVTSVDVPATVTAIGKDAFKGCSSLATATFGSTTVPFSSSVLSFYSVGSYLTFYVPEEAYSSYRSAFDNKGKVYAELSATDIPEELTLTIGEAVEFQQATGITHYNRDLVSATSSDSNTMQVETGTDGEITLSGIAIGTATLQVNCLKPEFTKEVKVNVIEASSIFEISAAACSATEVYDLQGRRVANPGSGIYIVNGKKTLIK